MGAERADQNRIGAARQEVADIAPVSEQVSQLIATDHDSRRAADAGHAGQQCGQPVARQYGQKTWVVQRRPWPQHEQPVQSRDHGGIGFADSEERDVMVGNGCRQRCVGYHEEQIEPHVQMVGDEVNRRVQHQHTRCHDRKQP